MPPHCGRGTLHSATYVYKICGDFSCVEAQGVPARIPTVTRPAHSNNVFISFFIASPLAIEIAFHVSQRKSRTTIPSLSLAQFMSRQISEPVVRGIFVRFRKGRV